MKKAYITLGSILMSALVLTGMASCSDENDKTAKPSVTAGSGKSADQLPNYRYVDVDTIFAKYNLAKDYEEEMLRMQNNATSQMKQKESQMQSFANQVQTKMQNNGYLSQESYQQDEQKMYNLQADYERSAAQLQNNIIAAQNQANKAVADSIKAFIESYNATRGYDAIFNKLSTVYIDPALDITDEVVEGLNARYNKVKK